MISVSDALERLFALTTPTESEEVPLNEAAGRILSAPVAARLTQPPFDASAMDGYAVIADEAVPGEEFTIIGEAQAGSGFAGTVRPGEAVRIFTGAPVPSGATRVVIQEDTVRNGDRLVLGDTLDKGPHIRPAGADFKIGQELSAPRRLKPTDVALLAAMNIDRVNVARKPVVAIISTGDELVQPGEVPGPDQILASNSYGIAAIVNNAGGHARILPIARDNRAALEQVFDMTEGADLVITIGGASVGDYDLVGKVAADLGFEQSFYKIAIRPGKPLMAGRMGQQHGHRMMIGLPGNPVSSIVCSEVFVVPVIHAMLGLGANPVEQRRVELETPLSANGPREHYMRAKLKHGKAHAFERQDSALLTVLSEANCLIVRPPNDAPKSKGDLVSIVKI